MREEKAYDVVVIGAGAAGIFAAWRAASLGAKVLLIEKTPRIGTKISISGGGKCNVAHAGPIEEVIKAFRPNEARFIRPACYKLKNDTIVRLMTDRGLRVYTRDDGRVFPIDQTAKDVVAILRSYLEDAGVELRLETPVEAVLAKEGAIHSVQTGAAYAPHKGFRKQSQATYGAKALLENVLATSESLGGGKRETIHTPRVILATGGSSYPNSGTTGDGWPWVESLGHTLVRRRGALAPIYLTQPLADLSGVAVRQGLLRARQQGKEVAKWTGDILLTHQGVSGPCALGISRIVAERFEQGEVILEVDFCPDRTFEALVEEMVGYAAQHPRRSIRTYLDDLIPERLIDPILTLANVDGTTPFSRFDKKARNRLATAMKAWSLGAVRAVPIEWGEVVAGGVSLDEVDPQTMRSHRVQGLYLCGEVLDISGPVGGYNLQSAFATGYLAGETAAKDAGFGG